MGKDLLAGSSHKRSSHAKDEFTSVTVRKGDPGEKAGIRLEAEESGRVKVTNIASNGLFADTEIEIGDIVLSINGKRLSKGEGPEELVKVIAKAQSKVTVVVKKTSVKPRVAEKQQKNVEESRDNNVVQQDTFYSGQSRHNEDGSFAFASLNSEPAKPKKKLESVTILANKDDGQRGDEVAGLIFAVHKKLLFVSEISPDSVFNPTDLKVGDRVLSINDCNFRSYADARLAEKMVKKSQNAVTIVVEKGVDGFVPPKKPKYSTKRTSKNGGRRSGKRHSTTSDTDGSDSDSFGAGSFGENDALPLKKSEFKEMVIAAPKAFASQDAGVNFRREGNHVVVADIDRKSIFKKTSLEVGDIIVEINDVNFTRDPDKNKAWMTCKTTKETVTMLVLKREDKYKHQVFDLDTSSSNLNWS